MDQKKINKEHCKLIMEQLSATAACNYYADYRIRILGEINAKLKEYQELQAKTDMSEEERFARYAQLEEMYAFIVAAQEHHQLLQRLHEKSQRKRNEIDHKLASFRKRHGLEEPSLKSQNDENSDSGDSKC